MKTLDWIVLTTVLLFIVLYGIWKTRKINTAEGFLAGGRNSKWYLVGLSIMATQASAITFLSTPGQAYNDGLGFVQFYFGLPIAVVILVAYFVPKYFQMNVYTAYEYLENRFGKETRVLTALLFLLQRGLAAGITIFAPAIILSSILGWNLTLTNLVIGSIVIVYIMIGGTAAVNQTQKQQMIIIFLGLFAAFYILLQKLPISFPDAMQLSGKLGKLEAVSFKFDLNDKYNIWSALLGGTFLFLSYFGTDQSQVQRYLSAKSEKEAKTGLIFNGIFKIPMQFFILLTGVLVFVFFQFHKTPIHFNPSAQENLSQQAEYQNFEQKYNSLFEQKQVELNNWKQAKQSNNTAQSEKSLNSIAQIHENEQKLRKDVRSYINENHKEIESNDKDYVFIYFILNYLPTGLVGLLLAVILSAAMSSTASELNALATTTVVDIYKRNFAQTMNDKQFLLASKAFTVIWGILALIFAINASLFENLIQAVNIIGSLFYGVILGVFVIAFLFEKIKGRAVLLSILIVEPIIITLYVLNLYNVINLAFLWLNPIGCILLVVVGQLLQSIFNTQKK